MDHVTFEQMRVDVIKQWPTAGDIDHDAAIALHIQNEGTRSFHRALSQAKESGQILIQPRCGVPSVDAQIKLMRYLKEEGGANLLSVTIDSYTRHNRYIDAEKGLVADQSQGRTALNGLPLVNHGISGGRRISEGIDAPIQVRHGSPDARLLAEITFASGISSFEGGPITYTLPYSKHFDLHTAIEYWKYVDRLAAWYTSRGACINRESFGPLTGILLHPSIEIVVSILEALLMAKEGVTSITLGHSQTGCLVQDIASIRVMRSLATKYCSAMNHHNIDLTIAYHHWMGPFPRRESEANGLIAIGSACAKLSDCNKIITKTSHEALGIPTAEANANSLRLTRYMLNYLPQSLSCDAELLDEETAMLTDQASDILDAVLDGPHSDLADNIVDAINRGIVDLPFAAHRLVRGRSTVARDASGALRFRSCGNMPIRVNHSMEKVSSSAEKETLNLLNDIFYYSTYAN